VLHTLVGEGHFALMVEGAPGWRRPLSPLTSLTKFWLLRGPKISARTAFPALDALPLSPLPVVARVQDTC